MDLDALMKDEAFNAKLDACQTMEEISALLKANGVEMTADQLQDLMDKSEGELNVDALEDVAGGVSVIGPAFVGGVLLAKWLYKRFRRR